MFTPFAKLHLQPLDLFDLHFYLTQLLCLLYHLCQYV